MYYENMHDRWFYSFRFVLGVSLLCFSCAVFHCGKCFGLQFFSGYWQCSYDISKFRSVSNNNIKSNLCVLYAQQKKKDCIYLRFEFLLVKKTIFISIRRQKKKTKYLRVDTCLKQKKKRSKTRIIEFIEVSKPQVARLFLTFPFVPFLNVVYCKRRRNIVWLSAISPSELNWPIIFNASISHFYTWNFL